MILAIVVIALAVAGIVATACTVRIDGYRRIPYTPIARQPEFFER